MGVKIGGDAAKSGKNTHLLVVIPVVWWQNIGLLELMNRTWFKRINGYKIRTKSARDYWGMCLMLYTQSIYYWYTNFDLLGVHPGGAQIVTVSLPDCLCLVLLDVWTNILFEQRELLIGTSVSLSLPASGFNSNMIGLEAFRPTILFTRLWFET